MTLSNTIEHIPELAEEPSVKAASGMTKVFTLIALVLSLLAAGSSFLLYQQLQRTRFDVSQMGDLRRDDISGKIASLAEQISKITAGQKAFQAQLMTEHEDFNSRTRQRRDATEVMTRKLEISNQQLLQSVNVLFKQKGREHIGWVLSEVEYLLLVANQSLLLQGNIRTAIKALQLADKRLLDTGDPGSIEIRTRINEEIEQLKALKQTDTVQLAAKLAASIKMVNQLPVNYTRMDAGSTSGPMDENKVHENSGTFEQAGKEFLTELKSLVVLRQKNEPVRPLITPEETFFLQQNLQLKLETARFALLSGKQELYADSLREAIKWLETFYDPNVHQVAFMLATLRSLLEQNISPPVLPGISHSINLLRAYQVETGKKMRSATDAAAMKNEVKP